MPLRSIAKSIRDQKWTTLSIELTMVIVGILLAFQVDRLYESWQDRQLEERYLERLAADLESDTTAIATIVARTERRVSQVQLLADAITNPTVAGADPSAFVRALEQVTWRSVPTITTYTYDELVSTGRMVLIESETLRTGLAEYYGFLSEQTRLGLGEDDQDRFRLETVGLLTGEHLSAIEDPSAYSLSVTEAQAIDIAQELASRRAAHDWLSRLQKYQVLMRRQALDFGTRARTLLGRIEEELPGGR